jgi:alpha-glucosidase
VGGVRWWHDAVAYEVYVPSFQDSSGDGLGDLRGVTGRLEHLAWLGVDLVWLTPFYPSPMRDHGYDISDYVGVDPRFGTLEDFDGLLRRARELGLRVVLDLVPNHTSSDHEWFRRARSSREDPYRDYYLWRDPAPGGGRPNNWVSHFGGPAWTLDEATGQYWCHLFLPEQPDLNWRNPEVAAEFDRVLRFWLDRGVSGFRIDVAHALVKHPDFPDLPEHPGHLDGPVETTEHERLDHIYDVDQPDVLDVYRRWRGIAEPYDALLVGEVYVLEMDRLVRYVDKQDGLHASFWFAPLHAPWEPRTLRKLLEAVVDSAPGAFGLVQGSHDRSRSVSRFGGGALGRARALALQTLYTGLPGIPFVYQGEELGLEDAEIPPEASEDPIAARGADYANSRDRCRTPMPWAPGSPTWGFSDAERAWLPSGDRAAADTVEAQRDDPGSMLHRYRALIALRREREDLRRGAFSWLPGTGDVLAYRRGELLVAANAGERAAWLPLPPGGWEAVFASDREREGRAVAERVSLEAAEAIVLARSPGEGA